MSLSTPRKPRHSSRSITKRPGIDVSPTHRDPDPVRPAPVKIKKSDIRPPDPTAPVITQFSETVKRAASYLLKSIGTNRPELKPALNRAFSGFFHSFDKWMLSAGRVSQRKINEPAPSLGLLERSLKECSESLMLLRDEVRTWTHADAEVHEMGDSGAPVLITDFVEAPQLDTDFDCFEWVDALSMKVQNRAREFRSLERLCDELYFTLQAGVEIDFETQERICQTLR
jgi:hypothetical protein